ncbi:MULTISPECIES: hypothetical protein [Flavobacteriaceae]|uniref:hypothetical protein n=1 Tax=Flavobacteriaceae TaxID=49546 RepID=UPI001492302B|nr:MULTISPECIES: hypothetical protein [Allomuricauda]MDC6364431.1 hypothetical protein [Muricauda sp. AC10]
MKKIYLLFLALTVTFYSCDTEDTSTTEENLEAVSFRYKHNKWKKKECKISVTPDLPASLNACTTAKGVDADNSYFDLTISDTSLAGDYGAWCVDVDLSLNADQCFEADVYSSYETLPDGKFEHPENFDMVNWILNQDLIGSESPSGGTYTFGDVQWAIWELIDDRNCISCAYLGDDWNRTKGQEIVDMALANGEGFEPGDGDSLAVILIPTNNLQSIFVPYELECKNKRKRYRGNKYKRIKRWKKGRKKFKCS